MNSHYTKTAMWEIAVYFQDNRKSYRRWWKIMGGSDNFFGCSATVDVHTNDVWTLRLVEIRLFWENTQTRPRCSNWQILVVYHWQKVSGRSGWKVNGTRLLRSFRWKILGSNRTSEKVALFSPGRNVPNENSCFIRFLQSHSYLIPVSAFWGSFSVNATDKCKW